MIRPIAISAFRIAKATPRLTAFITISPPAASRKVGNGCFVGSSIAAGSATPTITATTGPSSATAAMASDQNTTQGSLLRASYISSPKNTAPP